MHHIIGGVVIGAVLGGSATTRGKVRPALRGIIKGGIAAKRKLQAAGEAAMQETQKLVEEARAELDQPQAGQAG